MTTLLAREIISSKCFKSLIGPILTVTKLFNQLPPWIPHPHGPG
jgi:hypothetical protein